MLLSLMRRHAKSWLIKFMIAIIALVFIFYFGYSYTSDKGAKVAEVNGEIISRVEYQEAYRNLLTNLQQEYKNVWSDNLIKRFNLKSRALESLINEKVISQEAERIGLDVTDKEIQDQVTQISAFQSGGRFDQNRYKALLANNRMEPEDFEASISRELLQEKLYQFLRAFMVVSDQEVMDQYKYLNEQVKVSFVQFSPGDFEDTITVDKTLMEEYYQQHKEAYRIPEKIKIAYITVSPDNFRGQLDVDEQEVINYYEDNLDMFTEEKQIRARHILFRLGDDATEEEKEKVREKAQKVLEKARAEEDFAELAREYSEGPTKEDGGDLGFFQRGTMIEEFEDVAFGMEEGEISSLVETSFGYHIIKVEEVKPERVKELDEVRDQIEDALVGNMAQDIAHERALTLIDQMPYDIDLMEYGGEHGVQVATSGFFSRNEPIPMIEGDSKLKESIFSFEEGEISEVLEFNDNFYIIQVREKQLSYIPEIGEVYDRVEDDYIEYLASQKARAEAEQYMAELRGGADWEELAGRKNMDIETTDFFSRRGYPSKLSSLKDLHETAFQLGENNRYPDGFLESDEGVFVIRWEGKKGVDKEKYNEEKEDYRDSIMMTKQQSIYNAWLERLKEKADIDRSPFKNYR